MVRGGGLVVSALAYCSEDLSSNPASYKVFIVVHEKTKINEKEVGVGPFKKNFKLYLCLVMDAGLVTWQH